MQTTSAILSTHRRSQVGTSTYANQALGKTLNDIGFRGKMNMSGRMLVFQRNNLVKDVDDRPPVLIRPDGKLAN